MDPNAFQNVFQNVLIATTLGGAYGATYGLARRSSSILFAGTTAGSTFLGSAFFFGVREYVISPFLLGNIEGGQFALRRALLRGDVLQPRSKQSQWDDIRMHKMPDSAAAGALTGGVLNTIRRGTVGILPGAVTIALTASVVQYVYNEVRLVRIKYVSREIKSGRLTSKEEPERPRSFQEYILDALGHIAPIRKISDEEYIVMTEKRRAQLDERLLRVQKELQDIDAVEKSEGV